MASEPDSKPANSADGVRRVRDDAAGRDLGDVAHWVNAALIVLSARHAATTDRQITEQPTSTPSSSDDWRDALSVQIFEVSRDYAAARFLMVGRDVERILRDVLTAHGVEEAVRMSSRVGAEGPIQAMGWGPAIDMTDSDGYRLTVFVRGGEAQ